MTALNGGVGTCEIPSHIIGRTVPFVAPHYAVGQRYIETIRVNTCIASGSTIANNSRIDNGSSCVREM